MRPTFVVATALFLLSGIGVAEAADSTQLAEAGRLPPGQRPSLRRANGAG